MKELKEDTLSYSWYSTKCRSLKQFCSEVTQFKILSISIQVFSLRDSNMKIPFSCKFDQSYSSVLSTIGYLHEKSRVFGTKIADHGDMVYLKKTNRGKNLKHEALK